MTTGYRPTDPQIRHYWDTLAMIARHYLRETAREQGPEVAAAVLDCFGDGPAADGTWCIRARCDLDDDDTPDPDTLVLVVYVRLPGGDWQPFFEANWYVLMPPEWAEFQVQTLALAHGLGIPDTPAELFTDPPPATEA